MQALDKSVAISKVHPNRAAADAYLDHSYKLRKSLDASLAEVSLSDHPHPKARKERKSPPASGHLGKHDGKDDDTSSSPPKKKMMRRKKKAKKEL